MSNTPCIYEEKPNEGHVEAVNPDVPKGVTKYEDDAGVALEG
jgi:hypothetical protein